MSNRERGEVSFEADGNAWTLKVDANAMCEIEEATGKTITEIGRVLGNEATASISLMRSVFWGALQHHHDGLTLKDAGKLISDIGMDEAGRLIGEAFKSAFPQKKGKDARPRKATTG